MSRYSIRTMCLAISTALLVFSGTLGKSQDALNRSTETLVRIQTQPPQAQVSVDGRTLGQTPLASGDLKPGFYQLTVTKDGFVPLTVSAFVRPGQTVDIGVIPLAKTPASIGIWRVGSPHDNDTPPSVVPPHLGMLAKKLGIELKVRSLNAQAFPEEFRKALQQPDRRALPDVLGGNNYLPFEALLSDKETGLLATQGVLQATDDFVFLVRNSPNHIAARSLALANTNEIWRERTTVEAGRLPGQLSSDADRNALTDANSKAVYSYVTEDTGALASLTHPKTLSKQGVFGGSAHNIRVSSLRHSCFLGNARLAFVVCRSPTGQTSR